ncbi:MAG: hypothetical protein FD126_3452 [Elusimicrobia bacterium]|nr:MAG: hypothetical protein FD126_3452 [Elusimicrobiota bacterium]
MDGTIYVDCPCCGTRLEVERDGGKVVQKWAKREKPAGDPLKAALEKIEADKRRRANFFVNAKDEIEARKKATHDKFEEERRRIIRENDNSPPPRPFDFD